MADFFSLLSLTLIYFAIAFGSPSRGESGLPVASSLAESRAESREMPDPHSAFVGINSTLSGLQIIVVPPFDGPVVKRQFEFSAATTTEPSNWVLEVISTGPTPRQIIFRLPRNESRVEAMAAFVPLARTLSANFRVSLVPQ